jgi:hypothetical protein
VGSTSSAKSRINPARCRVCIKSSSLQTARAAAVLGIVHPFGDLGHVVASLVQRPFIDAAQQLSSGIATILPLVLDHVAQAALHCVANTSLFQPVTSNWARSAVETRLITSVLLLCLVHELCIT